MRTVHLVPTMSLLIAGAACTEWHVESVSPQQLIATHPSQLRVTLTKGNHLVIPNPGLVADTLVGIGADAPMHVPLSLVKETATRRVSAVKTGLLVGGLVAAVLVIKDFAENCCPVGPVLPGYWYR